MNTKLSIIGRGTVGAMSVAFFLKYTNWTIDWIFDEEINPVSVGEATNVVPPRELFNNINFRHHDLLEIGGTVKQGIYKKYWGQGSDFLHPFSVDSIGIHFSANELHSKILELVKDNPRITIIKKNIKNPEDLKSDFIMVCSGTPEKIDENFTIIDSIPVNSAFITQCEWESPKFSYSLTNAMKHGWVFGIPLQKRISIGYLYNDKISSLEEVKEDVKNTFKEYNLNPSKITNHIKFQSFYRKENFKNRIIYNGNASFFIEPLEATSTSMSTDINRLAWDVWNGYLTAQQAQEKYEQQIKDIRSMILLHYMSGSIHKNNFWDYAEEKATNEITKEIKERTEWSKFLFTSINGWENNLEADKGTWHSFNYKINVKNLGLTEKINKIFKD